MNSTWRSRLAQSLNKDEARRIVANFAKLS
jgi:hypothetical protein